MEFQVSPMQRWKRNTMRGQTRNFPPRAFQTSKDDVALRIPIVDQMIGNAIGGGIQPGLLRSAISLLSPFKVGRRLSSGENIRLLNAMNRKNRKTATPSAFAGRAELTLPRTPRSFGKAKSKARRVQAMSPNCTTVA